MPTHTIRSAAALAVAGLFLTGCGTEGGTSAAPVSVYANSVAPPVGRPPAPGVASAGASSPGAAAPNAPAADAGPVIPSDAKYTITCQTWSGNGHIQLAKGWRDVLVKATGRHDFYLINDDNGSTLYYGYYRQIDHAADPAEAKRADADLAFVRGLADGENHLFFPGALKEPLRVPDPEAPPQYDLARIDADKAPDDPARKYWSIAIAAYTADGNFGGADAGKSRKQLAVEAVLAARKMGIEAFYYNGENVSTVCIGAWPRDAVKEQDAKEAKSQSDSGQELVVSTTPLPQTLRDEIKQSGKDVKVFEPKVDIDEGSTLLPTWRQYREYSVNGYVKMSKVTDEKTGVVTQKPQESFLVEIPRLQPSILPTAQAEPDMTNPADSMNPLQPASGAGRLRAVTP